ncbi:unnamed protein product [Notodromas monacha]|uniref:C2 domain-containing protein n=1 Tax=Notodromas monacha TaxID=399045 RepID=A0A7R9BBL6_9CRUS|nr:unnamed protein product [Notodromas monacha]CAG0912255.1 unnamed protein product [Notodromas monacha]
MGVRLRLYGCERLRRERLIGETVVGFASVNLDIVAPMWLTLEPKLGATTSDVRSEVSSVAHSESTGSSQSRESYSGAGSASGSSTCRRSSRGSRSSSSYAGSGCVTLSGVRVRGGMAELLIGLTYKSTTGRLSVDVLRGSHFRQVRTSPFSAEILHLNLTATRSPDTYVCLSLISSNGQEISSSRTSVRRAQANPVFKESFMYQVPLFQVGDVTLMVTVLTKKGIKRKEMIGWFSLGLNSSGDEELGHWNEMRESPGEEVIRWHVLLDS